MFTLRRCEKYTNWEAGRPVKLDPAEFKNLPIFPYHGDVDSEKEFLDYIDLLYQEDWYTICDELEEDGRTELSDQIAILFESGMDVYSSTTDKYSTEWFAVGDEDKEYTKYGGFNARHSTLEE